MTKQEWETEARNYRRKINAEMELPSDEQNISLIDYYSACERSCYESAASAIDENDLDFTPEWEVDYSRKYF